MKAIFDSKTQLVAWVKDGKYVFTTRMKWIAFIANNHVYTTGRKWLGGYVSGSFLDKRGKPVAWTEGTKPISTSPLSAPQIPLVPLSPLTPISPITPMGGWSDLNWSTFIS